MKMALVADMALNLHSLTLFCSSAHFAFHAPVSSAGRTFTSDSARAGKPGLTAGGRGMEVTPSEINSGLATFSSTNRLFSTVPWVFFTWFWAPCTVLALYGHKGHWYLIMCLSSDSGVSACMATAEHCQATPSPVNWVTPFYLYYLCISYVVVARKNPMRQTHNRND